MIFLVIKGKQTEVIRNGKLIKLDRPEFFDSFTYAWTTDDNLKVVIDWYNECDSLLWFRHSVPETNQ